MKTKGVGLTLALVACGGWKSYRSLQEEHVEGQNYSIIIAYGKW